MPSGSHSPDNLSEWRDGPTVIALRGDDKPETEFRLGTREYDWHHHARGQLFCVETGMIQVQTAHGAWLLPPQRAGWIPPDLPHQIRVTGVLTGWSLLISPHGSRHLPTRPCVLAVSHLLRALAERAASWHPQAPTSPEQSRIECVILDEMRQAPHQPLHLPMPSDPRLFRVTQAIAEDPGGSRTLAEWAAWGAMSSSTLRRLMLAQTGLTFSQWRQQAQLARALEMLARGAAVNSVSDALGYASPSNFIVMFRRAFGYSPGSYFSTSPAPGARIWQSTGNHPAKDTCEG